MALLWLTFLLPLASSQSIDNSHEPTLAHHNEHLALELLRSGNVPSSLHSDLKLLYARLVASLVVTDTPDAINDVNIWMARLNQNGSFKDVDYKNQARAGSGALLHWIETCSDTHSVLISVAIIWLTCTFATAAGPQPTMCLVWS